MNEIYGQKGPVYGVQLIGSLPLGKGGMSQALPSRSDLVAAMDLPRVVAGYEVLLDHWRHEKGVANILADELAKYTGTTVPQVLAKAREIVEAGKE